MTCREPFAEPSTTARSMAFSSSRFDFDNYTDASPRLLVKVGFRVCRSVGEWWTSVLHWSDYAARRLGTDCPDFLRSLPRHMSRFAKPSAF